MKKFLQSFLILTLLISNTYAVELIPYEDPKTNLHGFKNNKGKIAIPAQFQTIGIIAAEEELVPVFKNGTFYRMDREGNLKFESVFYDNGWDYYEEGLARIIRNGKIGFHNKKGDIIISSKYDYASYFKQGYSTVCIGCWEYYPKSPKFAPLTHSIVIQPEFSEITGGKWGVINNKGQIVVPIKYNSIEKAEERINK